MRRPSGPSLTDVAKAAGVGTGTAGRALGGYGKVRPSTRAHVLAVAESMGYRPNRLAQGMIAGRTRTIGVVCADVESPFFSRMVRGISDVASENGYGTLLTNSDENVVSEREALEMLLESRVAGVVVTPADVHNVKHLKAAVADGFPVVLADRLTSVKADSVLIDSVAAMYEAVTALLKRGHRRVAILAELRSERDLAWQDEAGRSRRSGTPLSPSAARVAGYIQAHNEAGVPVDPELVRATREYSADAATAETLELLSSSCAPTALIAADDVMSIGAYRAIVDARIRIPRDLSFVAFDDLPWLTLVKPQLSVVRQPVYEIGTRAATLLFERINGNTAKPRRVVLPYEYVSRGSVASL